MNKSTIFLIFLIAPFAFAQIDLLKKIDRTPEGKQVLDSLLLQTKLMGDNLDMASLRLFLKSNRDKAEEEKNELKMLAEKRLKSCDEDDKSLGELLKAHNERQFALKRHVESSKRTNERVKNFAGRASEELQNYKSFETYVQEGNSAWTTYFTAASENFKSLQSLLNLAIEANKVNPSATSFVELPQEFHSNLAEMKIEVQNIDLEYTGMGPVVSNLMEIMIDPNAASKPEVRTAVRNLAESLLNYVRDRIEDIEEQNEHQSALFDSLIKTYHENYQRSEKEVAALKDALKNLGERLNTLTKAFDNAAKITQKVSNVVDLKNKECDKFKHGHSQAVIRAEKAASIITQIEGVLAEKAAHIKTFFIQREMRQK